MKRLTDRLLVIGAGGLIALLLLELGLRATGAFYWRDEGRADHDVRENLDPALLECDGCKRVLCLGDSFTYGVGATAGNDYPSRLQALLQQDPAHAGTLVVNGGMGDSNSRHALDRLYQFNEVVPLDLVVVMTGPRNSDNFTGYDTPLARGSGLLDGLRIARFGRYVVSEGKRQDLQSQVARQLSPVDMYMRWHDDHGTLDGVASHRSGDLFQQGADLLRFGRFEPAIAVFRQGVEEEGDCGCHHWGLGTALRSEKRLEEAKLAYERGIEADPDDPYNYLGLGEVLRGFETQWHDGEQWLRTGMTNVPDCAALPCMLAIYTDWEEGLELSIAGVQLDPDEMQCYPALLMYAQQLGRTDELRPLLEDLSGRSQLARSHLEMMEHQDPDRAVEKWLHSDLDAMVDHCQRQGIEVVFMQYPQEGVAGQMFPGALANRIMEALALEREIPCVATQPAFEEVYRRQGHHTGLFRRDGHPNDHGYALMAQQLHAAIVEQGLLTP